MWSDEARKAAAEARKGSHSGQIDNLPAKGEPVRTSGGQPVASNADAAAALSAGNKSTTAPVHEGMNTDPNKMPWEMTQAERDAHVTRVTGFPASKKNNYSLADAAADRLRK